MQDWETTTLIIVRKDGNHYQLDITHQNQIATGASVSILVDAMIDKLGLKGDYELYVKVPNKVRLDELGLDSLSAALLLPVEVKMGNPFKPGQKV